MAIPNDLYRGLHADQYTSTSATGQHMNGLANGLSNLQNSTDGANRYYEEIKRQSYNQNVEKAPARLKEPKHPNLLLLCEDI